MMNLLSTDELAAALHISVRSLRNRLSTHPNTLPPAMRLPGQRKILFRYEDVQQWLDSCVQTHKKRGRPTKLQQQNQSQSTK